MIGRHVILIAAILAVVAACKDAPAAAVPAPAKRSVAGLEIVPLEIRSGHKVHHFAVEVARTNQEQARGLMFRPRLGPKEGMIFPFDPPRPASFWMKNTMIPLDLLFIRSDGTIARIAAKAVPYSLEQIEEGEPVAAVLEIAGGRAAKLGISERDTVIWNKDPTL